MRVLRSSRWWRTELRGNKVEIVRFAIKRHGSSAAGCFDIFGYAEFVSRLFLHNREDSFAARCEGKLPDGVKAIRVHSVTDWNRTDYFAAIGIYDCHHLVVATGKQAAV